MPSGKRVLILHSKRAHGRVRESTLVRAFERAGHDVDSRDAHKPHWKRRLSTADIVVAAGGDGTVARIAIALASKGNGVPPLAVIPTGKANNIARALGADASPARLAAALNQRPNARLAIGLIHGPWGKARFVEGAGIGPLASLLRFEVATLRGAMSHMRDAFRNARPHALRVRADRVSLKGDYVVLYALNIPALGPRLELGRNANPGDERLDLLLVTAAQQAAFARYLDRRAAGQAARCPIAPRRVRRVEIDAWPARSHGSVDDRIWPPEKRPRWGKVRIEIETTVRVLVPKA
jgi:diacylglycerol kinase (ATP)